MKFVAVVLSILVGQGCAFQDTNLKIALTDESAPRGPLSSLDTRHFMISEIIDDRKDKERIGFNRNGFGMKTADIFVDGTVSSIVKDAIAETLVVNGHRLSTSGVTISGEIDVFWFETDINFSNVELIGSIECELVFSKNYEEIYRNKYIGSYSDKRSMAGGKAVNAAMNGALASLAEEIAYDEDLVEALQ